MNENTFDKIESKKLKKMKKKFMIFSMLFLGIFVSAKAQNTNTSIVRVEIIGLKSSNGKILINLFDKEKGFPSNPQSALKSAAIEIKDKQAFIEFSCKPQQEYAIALVHDENNNGDMDKNFFGIPKEGYAFSNNHRPTIKSPNFKQASFKASGEKTILKLTVIY